MATTPASTAFSVTEVPAPSHASSHSLVIPFGLCIALGIIHLTAETYAPLTARTVAWAMGCVAILAASRYLRRGLFERLPLPEYALAQCYLVFGMPTITDSLRRGIPVSRTAVVDATWACALFITLALVACPIGQAIGRWLRPKMARVLPSELPSGGRWFLSIWVLTALALNAGARRLVPLALRFPLSIVASPYGVLVYVAGKSKEQEERRPNRALLAVAVAFAAAGMLSGMLVSVLLPLATVAVVSFMTHRRLPWRWLVAGILVFAVLNPAKHIFRAQQGWGKYDKTRGLDTHSELVTGPIEGALDWADAIGSTWGGEVDTSRYSEGAVDRFNNLSPVARTIQYTGRRVPYDRGKKWALIPYSFLPRILYPEKPDMTVEFNDRYNLLFGIKTEEGMRGSTFLFPIIADGYWNFGWFGVGLVGFIIGLYWGFVANLWSARHWSLRWLALTLFATYTVMNHLYGQIGGLPQTIIGIAAGSWGLTLLARFTSRGEAASQPLRT